MKANAKDRGPEERLTHFDETAQGHLLDVGGKGETHRIAVAAGTIRMKPETLARFVSGTAKKGGFAENRAYCRNNGGEEDQRPGSAVPSSRADAGSGEL